MVLLFHAVMFYFATLHSFQSRFPAKILEPQLLNAIIRLQIICHSTHPLLIRAVVYNR